MSYGIDPTYSTGFRVKPYDVILTEMVATAQLIFGEEVDLRETSRLYRLLAIWAAELSNLWATCERFYSAIFARTASGLSLRMLADDAGLEERDAESSTGTVTFTATGDPILVPAGTIVYTATRIEFTTNEDVTVTTTADVGITAVVAGINGNVTSGLITKTDFSGVTVTNANTTRGGRDVESSVSLRERYLSASTTTMSAKFIKSKVGAISSIRNVSIREQFPDVASFTIAVAPTTSGMLTVGNENYDQNLYDIVTEEIELYRPAATQAILMEPDAIDINIVAEVVKTAGYSLSRIQSNIESRLSGVIFGLGIGDDVFYDRVTWAIMEENGVENITSLTVNGGTSDIDIENTEIAVLGTVTINEFIP